MLLRWSISSNFYNIWLVRSVIFLTARWTLDSFCFHSSLPLLLSYISSSSLPSSFSLCPSLSFFQDIKMHNCYSIIYWIFLKRNSVLYSNYFASSSKINCLYLYVSISGLLILSPESMSKLSPTSHCFDYWSFIILKISQYGSFDLIFILSQLLWLIWQPNHVKYL